MYVKRKKNKSDKNYVFISVWLRHSKQCKFCTKRSVKFQEDMQNYRSKAFGSLPPHVFALAESAYSSLQVNYYATFHVH